MSYTTYDFSESISGAGINREDIESVIAAWGISGDYSEWTGGFLMRLTDGQFAYVSGWCDTTGWGCQDGTSVEYFDSEPVLDSLQGDGYNEEWDMEPADLNNFVKTGIGLWL